MIKSSQNKEFFMSIDFNKYLLSGLSESCRISRRSGYEKVICRLGGIIMLLILLPLNQSLKAQESASSAGTSSVLLLRFAPSPRTAGLGEAFTGLANDENSLYYNPAILTKSGGSCCRQRSMARVSPP